MAGGSSKPGSTGGSRPAGISKTAYQIVKGSASTGNLNDFDPSTKSHTSHSHDSNGNSNNNNTHSVTFAAGTSSGNNFLDQTRLDAQREKFLEDEIMGDSHHSGGNHQKSDTMQKNLDQMVKVLNSRLTGLREAARVRLKLCEEDLDPKSTKMSKQAPKIVDEFDEVAPKPTRDVKYTSSSTNVTTSNNTSNATTGIGHAKDNLVSSDAVHIDPYHLVVRTKAPTETAKKLESNLEELFGNSNLREMKNKKSKALNQNEKSKRTEQLKNEQKRMNRLRIEKKLQSVMENFVTRSVMDSDLIFKVPDILNKEPDWPVPVKWSSRDPRSALPENAEGEFDPDLLLRYAIERMNLPSGRKLFTWLIKQPMIQRYFVYMFFLIKVKFFEGESLQDQEAFLLRLISVEYRAMVELLASRTHAEHEKDFVFKYLPFIFTNGVYYGFYYVFPGSRHIYTKGFKKTIYMQVIQIMHGFQVCAISVKVAWAKLFPEDNHDDNEDGEDGGELFPVQLALKPPPKLVPLSRPRSKASPNRTGGDLDETGTSTKRGGRLANDDGSVGENSNDEASAFSNAESRSRNGENGQGSPKSLSAASFDSEMSFYPGASKDGYGKTYNHIHTTDFSNNPLVHQPLTRTYLKPPLEKPLNVRKTKRQNHVERINAQDISPQMAVFLSSMRSSNAENSHAAQTLRRTIPVNWCPAGGSDTHRRTVIHTDLHNEISNKLKHTQDEYHHQSSHFHNERIHAVQDVKKTLTKVLGSGTTNISRFSLDLIRRQRALRGGKDGGNGIADAPPTHVEEVDLAEMAALANYDDEEVERFLAEF